MKYVLKALFRPISNRQYTNRKVSAVIYAVRFIPVVIICAFGAILVDSFFWLLLVGLIAYGFIDYIVFDAFLDKLGWKLFWHNFYSDEVHESIAEHNVMKTYESNPTDENYQALKKHIKSR